MESNGVDIYAISIQNEPDIQVGYESCDWTAANMTKFVKEYGDQITGALLMAPESFQFNELYTSTLLNDAGSEANLDIVAGHIYGSDPYKFDLAEAKGKEIWMTEYLMNYQPEEWTSKTSQEIWDQSLDMTKTIHESMSNNWNAYIWWYLKRYYSFIGEGDAGSIDGVITKRGYAFSHFAKYVRPGDVRIDIETIFTNPLRITAYKSGNKLTIVVINASGLKVDNVAVKIGEDVPVSGQVITTTLAFDRKEETLQELENNLVFSSEPYSVKTIVIPYE